MQRNPHRCRDVWERSKETSKGRYTAEEDALILERVKEQNSEGPGLWATLGRELDRPARTVRVHWLEMSAVKDKNTVLWTNEMVRILIYRNLKWFLSQRVFATYTHLFCYCLCYIQQDDAFLSTRPDTDQPKPFRRIAQLMQTMGYPVTERQCTARWHHHLRWKNLGYRTEGVVWTPEEVKFDFSALPVRVN